MDGRGAIGARDVEWPSGIVDEVCGNPSAAATERPDIVADTGKLDPAGI